MAGNWQIRLGQKIHGPFDDDQLRQLVRDGRIDADTPVRTGEKGIWQTVGTIGVLSRNGSSDDIDAIVDEVLGTVEPNSLPSSAEPDRLPIGQSAERPKVDRPTPSAGPVRQSGNSHKPFAINPGDIPPHHDLLVLGWLLGGIGSVCLMATLVGFVASSGAGSPQERILMLFVSGGATLGLFAQAAFLFGLRHALRDLRRIALTNERIASQVPFR